jgi:PAS domain S-box-containing protein
MSRIPLEDSKNQQTLTARDKLFDLMVNNLSILLFMIDRQGIVRLSVGKQVEQVRRIYPNSLNRSIYEVYADQPEILAQFERAVRGESFSTHREVGSHAYDIYFAPLHHNDGEIIGVTGIMIDTTDQQRVEEALVQSEARFQALIERAAIGVILKGLDGRMFSCNPAFLNMLGYTAQEIEAYSYLDLTHPLDQAASQRMFKELVSGERAMYTLEKRYRRKDGTYHWGRMTASLMKTPTGEAQFVIGMVEDIQARKEMEIELAEVQRRLIHSQELQRQHLAQELHDGPLQEVIGINYQLKALAIDEDGVYNLDQLHSIENALDRLTDSLRDMAGQLRPPALAPYGLEKAIRSHAEQFQKQHPEYNIVLQLARDRQALSSEVRLALYRIYQEAFNNILRHAKARTVWVRFLLDEENAVLEIQDDGEGFELPGHLVELARKGHYGLLGAQERIDALGGQLDIETHHNQGTLIRAVVPNAESKPDDRSIEK